MRTDMHGIGFLTLQSIPKSATTTSDDHLLRMEPLIYWRTSNGRSITATYQKLDNSFKWSLLCEDTNDTKSSRYQQQRWRTLIAMVSWILNDPSSSQYHFASTTMQNVSKQRMSLPQSLPFCFSWDGDILYIALEIFSSLLSMWCRQCVLGQGVTHWLKQRGVRIYNEHLLVIYIKCLQHVDNICLLSTLKVFHLALERWYQYGGRGYCW